MDVLNVKSRFSETLSSLRREKGFSQRQAAADLGVSQALLSHYENGAREPKLEFVIKACDYYGVTADSLLGRTEPNTALMMPVPRDCEGTPRLIAAIYSVFDKLEELSDQELYASAINYLAIPAENLSILLGDLDAPHDPMRDVALKLAEAEFVMVARKRVES